MKARRRITAATAVLLLLACASLGPVLHGQEAESAPAPAEAAPAATEPAPAAESNPAATEPAVTDSTPTMKEPASEGDPELFPSTPTPDMGTEPQILPDPAPELIPEQPMPSGTRKRGQAPKITGGKSQTEVASEELAMRIRYRQAKTRALGDAAIQAEAENARQAKTELEKREALKRYYKLLFTRISKIDARLKKVVEERQRLALLRLEQRRLDPTQPLDAFDRENPFVQ